MIGESKLSSKEAANSSRISIQREHVQVPDVTLSSGPFCPGPAFFEWPNRIELNPLKPQNFLLGADGRVQAADLVLDGELRLSNMWVKVSRCRGTKDFQLRGKITWQPKTTQYSRNLRNVCSILQAADSSQQVFKRPPQPSHPEPLRTFLESPFPSKTPSNPTPTEPRSAPLGPSARSPGPRPSAACPPARTCEQRRVQEK